MATFYLDYEGGNDANTGTSFAQRWKTITSGATAARIAPGDTIRIMGSPAPTSLGINGTWTDGPLNATVAIASSTNATPIVVTQASHGLTTGDTVIVNGHTTNTKANGVWTVNVLSSSTFELLNADGTNSVGNGVGGASGTFRKITNCVVTLASALTTNIALCGNQGTKTNWTASASVTCTVNTSDFKEGGECQSIALAAGFTTGKAAYVATGTKNLSSKKQVSFWIKQTAGTVAIAGDISLRLCSDAAGAVTVDTIAIPGLSALNRWMPITVDKAAALGAAIESVALYVDTDRGAQTFLLDCIIACNDSTSADSLSQTSLLGKNSGTETWWGIQSINGTRVMLDRDVNCIPAASPQRGYSGTTETVTAYKRETIKLNPTLGTDMVAQEDGAAGSLTSYSGGWNRTDMSTQTLETWFDRQGGAVSSIGAGRAFNGWEKINVVRAASFGLGAGTSNVVSGTVAFNNASGAFINSGSAAGTVFGDLVCASGTGGIAFGAGQRATSITSLSQNTNGVTLNSSNQTVQTIISANSVGVGVVFSSARCVIGRIESTGHGSSSIRLQNASGVVVNGGFTSGSLNGISADAGTAHLRDFTIGEATKVTGWTAGVDACVFLEKEGGVSGVNRQYGDGWTGESVTSPVHGSSAMSWSMSPTSTSRVDSYPASLPIAVIACAANALVTVKAWMRRTDTGLTMKLVCPANQLSGIGTTDIEASMTAAANTWEELTITFTPTEEGAVEVFAYAYGGTTYTGYVCDITVTQA